MATTPGCPGINLTLQKPPALVRLTSSQPARHACANQAADGRIICKCVKIQAYTCVHDSAQRRHHAFAPCLRCQLMRYDIELAPGSNGDLMDRIRYICLNDLMKKEIRDAFS